jgi:hypothetical protein
MALAQHLARLTEAEYLRLKSQAETRSGHFGHEMFARAGGTH